MGFFSRLFGKKKNSEKVLSDRELISDNEKSINSLILLAENNRPLIDELKALQEQIKYLVPSNEGAICDFDKDIKNNLEDLRTAITKSDDDKIASLLKQIKLAISDRNAKL